ncbi:MAG: nucleotide-binding protein [Pseudooceanicola nanhaiensis]
MQLIAFTSFKGGCGKTTTLMAMAAMLAARGRRIALFEADDNKPLALWRRHAEARGQWDARCALYPALDLDALEAAFEAAEADGCEIALVDTRGGGSEFNQTILLNAALTVVPTNLSSIEVDEALQTLRYVIELMRSADELRPLGLAINRVTPGRLSAGERDGLEILKTLPIFEARLSSRRVFADLKGLGHLHLHHAALQQEPGKRIAAGHTGAALREAEALAAEMLDAMEAA